MNRSGQIVGAFIATIGITKILFPAAISQFFALDTAVALVALAVAVLAYGVWYGPLRFLSGSSLTGLTGLAIVVIGATCIGSPTLLGLRANYLPIADIFLLLESGIVLQMIGLEKKRPGTLSPLLMISLVISLVGQSLVRRFSRSPRPVSAAAAGR